MIYSREIEEIPSCTGRSSWRCSDSRRSEMGTGKRSQSISGLTHGVGWCAPQQGACKLTLT